ncbi:MAG: biotin/lipoyl-binding protein, partial [Acidobacteriota bacterium]
MPRTVRWLFVLAIAAIGGFFLFSGDAAERPTEVAPVVDKRVEAARVDAAAARRSLRFSGVVRAVDRATLAFAIGGRMIARPVEVGDRVARGDVVARLDPRELDNAVAGAEGALAELEARREQARRDLERVEALVAAKAATSEERERTAAGLEAVAAGEDSARARLSEARRLRDEGVLRAPFAGTIT